MEVDDPSVFRDGLMVKHGVRRADIPLPMSTADPAHSSAVEDPPLVSILVPARNAHRWISAAVESATAQTYERVEIVVADNASEDETLEIIRSFADSRIRVLESPVNIGLVGNHNLLARASRGSYLKFLHADDLLFPDCVEGMMGVALADRDAGLVFAPRRILADGPNAAAWTAEFGRPHEHFDRLASINEGRRLMWQVLDAGFENWIGEPSSVLISRHALERVGLFNPRLIQICDLELWLRIALHFKLGFLDFPVSAYRHHRLSASAQSAATAADWLDPLWMAESLFVANNAGPDHDRLASLRTRRLLQALKNQSIRIADGRIDKGLLEYLRYRLRGTDTHAQRRALHPPLSTSVEEPRS